MQEERSCIGATTGEEFLLESEYLTGNIISNGIKLVPSRPTEEMPISIHETHADRVEKLFSAVGLTPLTQAQIACFIAKRRYDILAFGVAWYLRVEGAVVKVYPSLSIGTYSGLRSFLCQPQLFDRISLELIPADSERRLGNTRTRLVVVPKY